MKTANKFLFLLMCIIVCNPFYSTAQKQVKVNSKIDQVTVFLQGAQIKRIADVVVEKGTSEVVFEGVSPNLNTSSLQASGKGDFMVLSVRYHAEYSPPGTKKENAVPASLVKQISETEDSLTDIDFKIELINYSLNAWTKEKTMLERNKLLTGEGKTDSLALFIQAMRFYRDQIHDINKKIVDIKIERNEVQRTRNGIAKRLRELKDYMVQLERKNVTQASYSYQVIVTVAAKRDTRGIISINYLVNNASWVPAYELRAENSSEPVKLNYKGYISQNTGEEWEDVNIVLSTLNPQRDHTRPTLQPWHLRFYTPKSLPVAEGIYSLSLSNIVMKTEESNAKRRKPRQRDDDVDTWDEAEQLPSITRHSQSFSNVEFNIDIKYTIPSDGKNHQVVVMEENIPATYKYFLVPKIEQEAFLMARLTDWDRLNLLPGGANVYFMNTIIGSTIIDPNTINDTLEISFGRDPFISVTRKKLQERESSRRFGNIIEKEIVMEISIRNRRDEAVEIQMEDQIPVSKDEDIQVNYNSNNFSGAELNEQTGLLKWSIKLDAGESKSVTFSYTIRYPNDKNLILR